MAPFATRSLPYNLARGDAAGYQRFTADATHGVRLNQLNDGSINYSQSVARTSVNEHWDQRPWRLQVDARLPITGEQGSQLETVYLSPAGAAEFNSYTTTLGGEEALVFEWRGIAVHDELRDRLWVRIACVAPSGADTHDWYGWVGHECGSDSRIRLFEYPFLVVPSHATPKGGETAVEGAWRTRLLLPTNLHQASPQFADNMNVGYLGQIVGSTTGTTFRGFQVYHPGSFWWLGFATLCACNDLDAATYLRCLQVQARDANGWLKSLRWHADGTTDICTQLAPGHVVGYELAHGRGKTAQGFDQALTPYGANGFDNSYSPRWAVEVTTFVAENEDWWYDAAARYRQTIESTIAPPLITANPNVGQFRKKPGILFATIHVEPTATAPWFETIREFADVLLRELQSTETPLDSSNLVVHHQTWAQNYGDDVNHAAPDFSDEMPGLREHVAALKALGWRVSLYSRLNGDFGRGFTERLGTAFSLLPKEDGSDSLIPTVLPLRGIDRVEAKWRKSFPSFRLAALRAVLLPIVARYQPGCVYLDSYSGGNTIEGEPVDGMSLRHVTGNGGRYYTDQKVQMAIDTRAEVRAASRAFGTNPDLEAIVMSEVAEEHAVWDWHGRHYAYHEMHLDLADDRCMAVLVGGLAPASATDYPLRTRALKPPLWQCVHNRHWPTGAFTNGFDLTDLETCDIQQATGQGLTPTSWLNNKCLPVALAFVQGIHQIMVSQFMDVARLPAILNEHGEVANNTAHDPTGVGRVFLAFVRALLRGCSADTGFDFLVEGRMLRPLEVDHASPLVGTTPNPAQDYQDVRYYDNPTSSFEARAVNSNWFVYNQAGPPSVRYGNMDFEVVDVLHTVWEAEDGTIGIVLINWTQADAAWEGTVVPARYGLAGTVTVSARQNGGSPIVLGSSAAASFTIRSSAAVGGDVHLGFLPPRSITVLELT